MKQWCWTVEWILLEEIKVLISFWVIGASVGLHQVWVQKGRSHRCISLSVKLQVRNILRQPGESQELTSVKCARSWLIPLSKMLVLSPCRKTIGKGRSHPSTYHSETVFSIYKAIFNYKTLLL